MKTAFLPTIALVAPLLLATAAQAQTPPAAPKVPEQIGFTEELQGRRALFAARDAARNDSGVSFVCSWSVTTTNGPDKPTVESGTETLRYQPTAKKLALTLEAGTKGTRVVRKAISDGETLLGVHFDERGTTTTREFSKLYLNDVEGKIALGIAALKLYPLGQSQGVRLALQPTFPVLTRLVALRDGTVLEIEPSSRRQRNSKVRRYTFGPSKSILRFEEWETRQDRPRPATKYRAADDGTRIVYRREDYRPATAVAAGPSPYSTSLPSGYTEKILPFIPLPESKLKNADPGALALLARWQRADERYLTLGLDATVQTQIKKRTEESPDPRRRTQGVIYNGSFNVWLRRPALANATMKPVVDLPYPQTLSSDGLKVTIKDGGGRARDLSFDSPERMPDLLLRGAIRNSLDPLAWLIGGPPRPEDYDSIRLIGLQTAPTGEAVQVIELVTTERGGTRGDTKYVINVTYRVGLAADGLPRAIETVRKTDIEGDLERDQPPITTQIVALKLFLDTNPPVAL